MATTRFSPFALFVVLSSRKCPNACPNSSATWGVSVSPIIPRTPETEIIKGAALAMQIPFNKRPDSKHLACSAIDRQEAHHEKLRARDQLPRRRLRRLGRGKLPLQLPVI